MKRIMGIGVLVLTLAASASADYVDTRTLEIAAEDMATLKINCGAGYLDIEGVDGFDSIVVDAEIVLEGMSAEKAKKFIDKNMTLELEKKGKHAELNSWFEEPKYLNAINYSGSSRHINLAVKMPKDMGLNIDDGSGAIWIQNIGDDISIDDGSGEIEIEDVIGNIEIDDGSGKVQILNVTGDIEISDGSGEIYVREVDGGVVVSDGSGDIDISSVTQDVEVVDDGSGSRRIRNVDGRVHEP